MVLTIAMDGPVGAGKSSVADEVARRLGILHLDTGAMYRAFAWQALKEGIDTNNAQALAALAERTMPEVRFENGAQRTLIGGTDVTDCIRTPEISMAASVVSTVPQVRRAMDLALDKQSLCLQSTQGMGEPTATDLTPGTGYTAPVTWSRTAASVPSAAPSISMTCEKGSSPVKAMNVPSIAR